jgi:hypothetical protein
MSKRPSSISTDEYSSCEAKRPALQDPKSVITLQPQKSTYWVRSFEYIKHGGLTDIRVMLKRVSS